MSRIQLTQRDNKSTTSSESSTVWRDLLDYKTLEVNMYHQNDEVGSISVFLLFIIIPILFVCIKKVKRDM